MSQIKGTTVNEEDPNVVYDANGYPVDFNYADQDVRPSDVRHYNKVSSTAKSETVDVTGGSSPTPSIYEANKYLYEAGLQNIFDDYQKNISILSQKQQEDLKQAYIIKEMSKKYLGEYASNNGIGDVSGNLIDIYGNYQKNLNEINANYDSLQLNLDQTYQQARMEQFDKIMQNQFNMNLAQLGANAQTLAFNIMTENLNGVDSWQALEQAYSNKEITDEDYRALYGTLYSQGISQMTEVLNSGFETQNFGLDESGNPITDPMVYLDSVRDKYKLTNSDYTSWKLQIEAAVNSNAGSGVSSTNLREEQPNYDPTYYMVENEDVGIESNIFTLKDEDGNQLGGTYVQIRKNVEEEESVPRVVTFEELDEEYFKLTGSSNPNDDDIVLYHSIYYVNEGGQWYRLTSTVGGQQMQDYAIENQSNWFTDKDKKDSISSDGSFFANGYKADSLVVMGITYVEDSKSKEYKNMSNEEQSAIITEFNRVHGSKNQCVIFYQGRFWERNVHGDIVPMKKKTTK